MIGIILPRSMRTSGPGRHVDATATASWLIRRIDPAAFVQAMLVVCLILLMWPASFGGRFAMTIVAGNSMEPTYMLGDAVVAWREPVEIGDTILYRVPEGEFGEGNPVIHRIVGGDASAWVTQGDNSYKEDDWSPASSDIIGVAKFRLPLGGRVLAVMKSWLFISFMCAIAVGLVLWPDEGSHDETRERGRHRAPTRPKKRHATGQS